MRARGRRGDSRDVHGQALRRLTSRRCTPPVARRSRRPQRVPRCHGADGVSAALQGAIGGHPRSAPEVMVFYAPVISPAEDAAVLGQQALLGVRQPGWCRAAYSSRARPPPGSVVPGADVNPTSRSPGSSRKPLGIADETDLGEPLVGRDYVRPVRPLRHARRGRQRFPHGPFADEAIGKDVVALRGGRRADGAVPCPRRGLRWERRGYFDVIWEATAWASRWRRRGSDRRAGRHRQSARHQARGVREAGAVGEPLDDRTGCHERLAPPRRGRHGRVRALGHRPSATRSCAGERASSS